MIDDFRFLERKVAKTRSRKVFHMRSDKAKIRFSISAFINHET